MGGDSALDSANHHQESLFDAETFAQQHWGQRNQSHMSKYRMDKNWDRSQLVEILSNRDNFVDLTSGPSYDPAARKAEQQKMARSQNAAGDYGAHVLGRAQPSKAEVDIIKPLVSSGRSVGYIIKPNFQHFNFPNRKYKSGQQDKQSDTVLPRFVANGDRTDPAEKDIKIEGTLVRGNALCNMVLQDALEVPRSFEFTHSTKLKMLARYLGKDETRKIWKRNDFKNMLTQKYNSEVALIKLEHEHKQVEDAQQRV